MSPASCLPAVASLIMCVTFVPLLSDQITTMTGVLYMSILIFLIFVIYLFSTIEHLHSKITEIAEGTFVSELY